MLPTFPRKPASTSHKCFLLKERGGEPEVLTVELLPSNRTQRLGIQLDIQLYSNLMFVYILVKNKTHKLIYHSQFSCLSYYLGIASSGSFSANCLLSQQRFSSLLFMGRKQILRDSGKLRFCCFLLLVLQSGSLSSSH